jgi:hypothetical protein
MRVTYFFKNHFVEIPKADQKLLLDKFIKKVHYKGQNVEIMKMIKKEVVDHIVKCN